MIYFFLATPKHAADETGPLVLQLEGRDLQIKPAKGVPEYMGLALITNQPAALEAALVALAHRVEATRGFRPSTELLDVLQAACPWHIVAAFDPIHHFIKEKS